MNNKTKQLLAISLLVLCSATTAAQGIKFAVATLDEALKQADSEGKMVFVDFYTQWCGPCKVLSKNVFTQKEVGDYFNGKFVSIQLDAEHEGKAQATTYGVRSYPTLLFLKSDGSIVSKKVGSMPAEKLLDVARKAVEEKDSSDNLDSMKKQWAEKPHTEEFLLKYIGKMKEFREDPSEALEEYLGMQKSINPKSSKMMEFLIDNKKYFELGGNAERIYNDNKAEYMAIATDVEEKLIAVIAYDMMRRTRNAAMAEKNLKKYDLYLNRWLALKEKPASQSYTQLLLHRLIIEGNRKEYHRMATAYLDSMVTSQTLEEIRLKDQKHYEDYCKTRQGQSAGMFGDVYRIANEDLIAKRQCKDIVVFATEMLHDTNKKELKKIDGWISHCKQLLADNSDLQELECKVMYVKGDKAGAMETARTLLASTKKDSKKYAAAKALLDNLEKGNIFYE